ncbi:MAG: NAD(P)H-hydrate epimerase [Sedimentisphaerales bacterium]|nr:NAD(P)H-hydrate epimerase [Sedimentisphaerales bacterium]
MEMLSRRQVRRCDQAAIERYGIDGLVLMENAGAAAARGIRRLLADDRARRVGIVAGIGNNGGDGFVVARHLANADIVAEVAVFGQRQRISRDAGRNLEVLERMGLPIRLWEGDSPEAAGEEVRRLAERTDWLVDALLGTGLSGPVREPIRSVIEALNRSGRPIVALDIPSGLDCDMGQPLGSAVRARYTITFLAGKKGFLEPSASAYLGQVMLASIGIHPRYLLEEDSGPAENGL